MHLQVNKSNPISFPIKIQWHLFRTISVCKQYLICAYFSWFRQDYFSLEKAELWIEDHILARSNGLKLKGLSDGFSYLKHAVYEMLIDGLESDGTHSQW